MTIDEAEPDPNRNHEISEFEIDDGAVYGFSFAASGYRRAAPRAVSQVYVYRPDTGHTIFFRNNPPVDAENAVQSDDPENAINAANQADGQERVLTISSPLSQESAHTFSAALGVDAETLLSLLNVPEISAAEWHRRTSRMGPRSAFRGGSRGRRRVG